jgi:hypothetical protein
MSMNFKDLNLNPNDRELRVFSVIWLVGFSLFGALVWWRGGTWAPVLWGVALVGCALGLVAPRAMKPVYVGWMVAAFPIGWTISLVLLALVYYVIFTGFGLVFKVLGRDPLGRSFDRAARTYWVPRRQPEAMERYFKQF